MARLRVSVFPTLPQKSAGLRDLAFALWIALLGCGTGIFICVMTSISELWLGRGAFDAYRPQLSNLCYSSYAVLLTLAPLSHLVDKRIERLVYGLLIASGV
jgi:hypothetical protein